jgi:hypothetical protein
MDFAFAPGVFACLADGRLVILNVRADRYLMLPSEAEAALLRLIAGSPATAGDEAVCERLCTAGLVLQRAPLRELPLCRALEPERSLLDDGWPRSTASLVARAALSAFAAVARLKTAGLERTLDGLSAVRSPRENNAERTLRLAGAFAELRFAVRALDRCLPLSVALASAAKGHHSEARLVLGVQCHPFGAHAWVQLGGTVLNDRLDMVRSFTPILVL